ncbi:MAG TPA: MarR family winged helix-turn-helix transcriptional regulator [Alphaproteobacteria bacterium]
MSKARQRTVEAIRIGRSRRLLPLTTSRPELLAEGSDRDFRRLVHDLFGFFARHEAIRSGHAAYIGLNGMEYTILISIAHLSTDADVSVKVVADHLHLSGAFITTIVGSLVRKRLVHKGIDPHDRRRVRLTVSEKGYGLLARLGPVQRQVNNAEFECLSAPEFRQLLDLMQRLIAGSDRAIALQQRLTAKRADAEAAQSVPLRRALVGSRS